MTHQKWQLLSKRDVSPHKWLPIEMRRYKLPNGNIVEDFSVTTLADVSMIVPITKDKKVVLVRQFKPGVDEVILEFPAGCVDEHHHEFIDLAQRELEEETGIRVAKDSLAEFAVLGGFVTKGSERVHFFLARECEFNSHQQLDSNENIEVVTLPFDKMDAMILSGEIWTAQTIAGWMVAKLKFPDVFESYDKN